MAEAVVSFAIERIGDLLIEEAKFLHGVKEQVTELETELIRMQCFLEDADAIRDKNKRLRNWIAEITELAYRSEIVLDKFLLKVESMRRRGGFPGFGRKFGCFFNKLITLHKVGSEIESITNKLNNFSTRFQIYGMRDLRTRGEASSSTSRYEKLLMKRRTYSADIENDFVDLPDFTKKLVKDLVCQDKQYRAISICGVGGLGKTTLAKEVFHHKDVRGHFKAFAWACVSQQPKRDEILRGIWTELGPGQKLPEGESELIRQLSEIQATKKCLVVLDDIWSTDDWDIIKAAFPEGDGKGSIVLLTTRSRDLVTHVDPRGLLREPPVMSADQSLDLFCKKAFPGVDAEFTNELVEDLVDPKKQYRAISICGIGDQTALATKVYHHKDVRDHFGAFARACVSQQPKWKEILRGILTELMAGEEPSGEEISDLIRQLLEIKATEKCLVVLDDVWSTDDWDNIKAAFRGRDEKGSMVLLTTCCRDLVTRVDPGGLLKEPPLMSWDLRCQKAFPGVDAEKLKELTMTILKHCGGLPLAIAVLGGLLARKHTINEWMIVNKNIDSYLRGDKETKEVTEILALSYYDLPYWLKPCFLSLGNYPEDYEILTHTLYQLWIAEGFISLDEERRGKEETLMDVAERYLGELAQRSMVQVQMIKVEDQEFGDNSFGRFRSCRLHDLMREMCLSMVKEENFLKVIDHGQSSERQSRPFFRSSSTLGSKIHRLAIHGNENVDPSSLCIDQEKNIRGVLFFDGNKCTRRCREGFVSHLPKNFKLVRVMRLENFDSDVGLDRAELPKAVGDLIHLRYFSVRGGMLKLPSSIGNLGNLQTLNLSNYMKVVVPIIIPNVLWKLKQLMHLYFPKLWEPVKENDKLRLDGLDNLEVLHQFDSRYFNVEDLQKLINLRSLTRVIIKENRQDLVAFVNYLMSISRKQLLLWHSSLFIREIDFGTEDEELALLKQIFFECHPLYHLEIHGRIRKLPEYPESFQSSLTHLYLYEAGLKEDPMARLEKLPNLAVLHLWTFAYLGKEMVCSVQGFLRLKKLMLGFLGLLEDWRVDEGAMPNLSYLEICGCGKLNMVPNGLRCITTLRELSIKFMPEAFVNRLKLPDGEDSRKVSRIPSIRVEHTETTRQ